MGSSHIGKKRRSHASDPLLGSVQAKAFQVCARNGRLLQDSKHASSSTNANAKRFPAFPSAAYNVCL
eukprot:1159892-Pelagomonas_calceolata.AAC.12